MKQIMESQLNKILMENITTFDGTTARRKDCRFIKGTFYIKNIQCFLINGQWHRINNDLIVFDNEVKKWVLKSESRLLEGVIGITPTYEITRGWFSENPNNNVRFYFKGVTLYAINVQAIACDLLKEGLNDIYYLTNEKNLPTQFNRKIRPKKDGFYTFPFHYGSAELIPQFASYNLKHFKGNSLLSDDFKYIEDFTFGIEFETSKGAIPEKYLKEAGLIPCRDGSIEGFEYTTIPLQGERGIQIIKHACTLLKHYCSCSPYESLHIHIGGYSKTIKSIASLYKLALIIQSDVYSIFPYFYPNTGEFKRKGYCNPLPRIIMPDNEPKQIMNSLYTFISGGSDFIRFPQGEHPMDNSGNHKWEVSPRYVWLNIIPLIWGTKRTVEFRCHTPTLSAQKVINWLYITIAILKYAEKYSNYLITETLKSISKITLEDIVIDAYPKRISNILCSYIQERRDHYFNQLDPTGETEVNMEDKDKEIFKLTPFV